MSPRYNVMPAPPRAAPTLDDLLRLYEDLDAVIELTCMRERGARQTELAYGIVAKLAELVHAIDRLAPDQPALITALASATARRP